jgi:hypothetical protein
MNTEGKLFALSTALERPFQRCGDGIESHPLLLSLILSFVQARWISRYPDA